MPADVARARDARGAAPVRPVPRRTTEVFRDLLDRDSGLAVLSDAHDVVTEFTRVGLGHSNILPGPPRGQARSHVTYSCSSPVRVRDRVACMRWGRGYVPELVAIGSIALARAMWVASRDPITSPDSVRYWNPADPLLTFRFDMGQGPGQLLQIIYLLPVGVAAPLQAFAAALLWAWASRVATRRLPRWAFWVALAFSLSPWWLIWDSRVITEALTLSGMALFAAGLMGQVP